FQTQCCNPNPNPEYSTLLYGAPRDARRALRRTLRNSNSMPRKQLKERVEQWAVHYNKTEQLTAVLNKSAAASQTIQKNIHMIFEQLPEFMAKLTAISANMELSVEGMSNSIEELNKSVNQTLADAACCIVSTVRMNVDSYSHDMNEYFYDDFAQTSYGGYPYSLYHTSERWRSKR
ncbi:hypothetical protein NECAME_07942, partial [Necator americanus]